MSHKRGDETEADSQGGIDNYLVTKAVKSGLGKLSKDHPLFAHNKGYLEKFIDPSEIELIAKSASEKAAEEERRNRRPISQKAKDQIIYEEISDRIRNGQALTEEGKEKILQKSLEEKAKYGKPGFMAVRGRIQEETQLEKTLAVFKEVYTVLRSGDYAHHMPEIAGALQELDKMHFAYAAARTLLNKGEIDEKEYLIMVNQLKHKSGEYSKHVKGAIRHYSGLEAATSIIMGIVGLGIILATSTGITSNVIGYNTFNPEWGGIALGILFIALSTSIIVKHRKK